MRKGDMVVPKSNPDATPAEVVAIDDLGNGEGNERVEVRLLGLRQYYAKKELVITKGEQNATV
jgi:hypothetical protein